MDKYNNLLLDISMIMVTIGMLMISACIVVTDSLHIVQKCTLVITCIVGYILILIDYLDSDFRENI